MDGANRAAIPGLGTLYKKLPVVHTIRRRPLHGHRAAHDPAFAKAMLDEAASAFLNDEPHVARLILRNLVNASVGFEALAAETSRRAHTKTPRRRTA